MESRESKAHESKERREKMMRHAKMRMKSKKGNKYTSALMGKCK
jgi:hypothetical protein